MMKRIYLTLMLLLTAWVGAAAQESGRDSYEFQRGREAFDKSDYQEAVSHFVKAIQEDPENAYAWAYLGRCNYQVSDMGRALGASRFALRYLPKGDKALAAQIYAWNADSYFAINDTLAALHAIEKALSYQPHSALYLATCGYLYLHMKQDGTAEDYGLMALKRDTAYLPARKLLMFAAYNMKRWDEVARRGAQISQRDSTDGSVYLYRLEAAWQTGHVDQAITLLPYAWRYLGFTNDTQRWTDSLACRDYAATDTALALGARRWPDDADLSMARVRAAAVTARKERQIGFVKDFGRVRGDGSEQLLLAYRYDDMYDYDRALEASRRALQTDSTGAAALEQMGVDLYRKGQYAEALGYLNRAVNAQPTEANAYYRRSQVNRSLGRLSDALTDAEYAATLDTTEATYQQQMARCLRLMGRGAEARPYYERILRCDTVATNSYHRQFALYYLGRTDEARQWCEQTIQAQEKQLKLGRVVHPNEYVYYTAARLYAVMGDKERALSCLRQALQLNFRFSVPAEATPDFDTLRPLPEYQALLKEYANKPTQWK